MMEAKAEVCLKINKPIEEVFEAIVNAHKLCQYFTSTASGSLRAGEKIVWTWADVDTELFISVQTIEENKHIVFQWLATGAESCVDITLERLNSHETWIKVLEIGWIADQQGIDCANRQTGGWMHMLCCLKAFLEYGIRLRDRGGCIKGSP